MSTPPLTEGPFGLLLTDRQAITIEQIAKTLPKDDAHAFRRRMQPKATTSELQTGDRADVSWISTEDIDRDREVVMARGMNDSQYQLNPIVTLNHAYREAPVGR